MTTNKLVHKGAEPAARVSLCGRDAIEIGGQEYRADKHTAFVDCTLSHAFPVVTVDNTALHPQVVANSYRGMQWKVFDLAHLMRRFDPSTTDHILGTVVAVEFPVGGGEASLKVQGERSAAPGIRAVACMHKNAENVQQILTRYFTGEIPWTVSMEQEFLLHTSGFIVRDGGRLEELQEWRERTPEDLRELGWTYVPVPEAPPELLNCFDAEEVKVSKRYRGCETVGLLGGLDGQVDYLGIGLTPMGKEEEAEVSVMVASEKMVEVGGVVLPDVVGLLKKTAQVWRREG